MTNDYTKAIALFEADAAKTRAVYMRDQRKWGDLSLSRINERDEAQERSLWAIELLHAAHVGQQRNVRPNELIGQTS